MVHADKNSRNNIARLCFRYVTITALHFFVHVPLNMCSLNAAYIEAMFYYM